MGLGWSIDWLPDGRLLVTGRELRRREPDGSIVRHADLRAFPGGWNEIVVDGRGNVYVNGADFAGGGEFDPATSVGHIVLVAPDGSVRQVAGDIAFPNGMVVTPDNSTLVIAESVAGRLTAFDIVDDGGLRNRRVWAEVGGDGTCLDAEGAIWCSGMTHGRPVCLRVREGGEVLQRIELPSACFACMLGGGDGRTLHMLVADWRTGESPGQNIERLVSSRTGRLLTAPAPAPAAGWPEDSRSPIYVVRRPQRPVDRQST